VIFPIQTLTYSFASYVKYPTAKNAFIEGCYGMCMFMNMCS